SMYDPRYGRNILWDWAIHRLSTETLVLGGAGTGRAPLRFQDALDVAAVGLGGRETRDTADTEDKVFAERDILCVPCYVDRHDLIALETRPTFVAEYVYWLKERPVEELNLAKGLDLYFLQLRGLGQWRACAVWIGATKNAHQLTAILGAVSSP